MSQHTSEDCKAIGHTMSTIITHGQDGRFWTHCTHCQAMGYLDFNVKWIADEEEAR